MPKTSQKRPFELLEKRALLVLELAANIEMHHLPRIFENVTRPERIGIALKAVEIALNTGDIEVYGLENEEVE